MSPAVLEQLRDGWLSGDPEAHYLVHYLAEDGLHRVDLCFGVDGHVRNVGGAAADYWAALEEALAQLPDEVKP